MYFLDDDSNPLKVIRFLKPMGIKKHPWKCQHYKNKFLKKNQNLEFRMLCPACCHRLAYASYSGHKQSANQTQTRKTSLAKTQTPWSDSQGVPSTGSRMLFKNGIM